MRHARLALGLIAGILLAAGGASAQANAVNPLLLTAPNPVEVVSQNALSLLPAAAASAASAAGDPQGAQGVFANTHSVQVYGGYTFVRFYEVPHLETNINGFNFSVQYYPRDWIALDGEGIAVFGSQSGTNTRLFTGFSGPRVRWIASRGFELWAHGLIGGGYFTPKTPFGSQGALAYEAGGGVDLSSRHKRFAIRLSADLLGTAFFSTYQLSPKISAGLVYKF